MSGALSLHIIRSLLFLDKRSFERPGSYGADGECTFIAETSPRKPDGPTNRLVTYGNVEILVGASVDASVGASVGETITFTRGGGGRY